MEVSIILVTWSPTKDRLDLLKQTLISLRESTEVPFQLIVVDNGPKEQTDFLKTQKIDKLISNPCNKGVGFCRNQAMQFAEGDYISFIDNDLIFSKDWLKESIGALEKYPRDKFVASAFHSFYHQKAEYYAGRKDEYFLWHRACPAGLVFRRDSLPWKWEIHPRAGTKFFDRIERKKFLVLSLPFSKITYCGVGSSYSHKFLLKEGKWRKEWGFEI